MCAASVVQAKVERLVFEGVDVLSEAEAKAKFTNLFTDKYNIFPDKMDRKEQINRLMEEDYNKATEWFIWYDGPSQLWQEQYAIDGVLRTPDGVFHHKDEIGLGQRIVRHAKQWFEKVYLYQRLDHRGEKYYVVVVDRKTVKEGFGESLGL
ncbi:hypothetical protein ACFLZY_00745 [Patescibacteria group bacterium]